MARYPSDTYEFLKMYWGALLLLIAILVAALVLIKMGVSGDQAPWQTVTPAQPPTDTSTPTTTLTPAVPPADIPAAPAATDTSTPRPSKTPKPTSTRGPTVTPRPTRVLPTPTVCPADCPAGMAAYKCDAQNTYCFVDVGHCGVADDCNIWCLDTLGYQPRTITWYCKKPSKDRGVQGVCVCLAKVP
jgi:hypothetical protein